MSEENNSQETAVVLFDEIIKKKALQQYNLTDARIVEMKEKADKLIIENVDDSEGYRKVKKAVQILIGRRTEVEKIRKDLKAPALEFGRAIDDEAKRITALLKPIEDDLVERKEKHEKELAANQSEEYDRRRKLVVEAGFLFDGRYYAIGSIFLHPDTLEKCTPEEFDEWLSRAEQEKIRVNEAVELRKERQSDPVVERAEAENLSEDLSKDRISEEVITPEIHRPETTTQKVEPLTQKVDDLGMKNQSTLENQMLISGFNQCRTKIIALLGDKTLTTRSALIEAINNLKPQF